LGDKVENYILKAGWSTPTLQKQFAINHLAFIAASATVGSGSVTPPKRMSNRKIKGFIMLKYFMLEKVWFIWSDYIMFFLIID